MGIQGADRRLIICSSKFRFQSLPVRRTAVRGMPRRARASRSSLTDRMHSIQPSRPTLQSLPRWQQDRPYFDIDSSRLSLHCPGMQCTTPSLASWEERCQHPAWLLPWPAPRPSERVRGQPRTRRICGPCELPLLDTRCSALCFRCVYRFLFASLPRCIAHGWRSSICLNFRV